MYDEELNNLDDWLRRLKVEYEIFFNGHRKKPPDDLKLRVEKLIKKLSEVQNMSYAERFRYNTLITRFYVFRDKWRRQLASREASGELAEGESRSAEAAAASAPSVRVSIADPQAEEAKVRALYEALLKARKKHGKKAGSLSYPQFAGYIAKQTQSIRERYGCARVEFAIAVEEDAVRFIATAENPLK